MKTTFYFPWRVQFSLFFILLFSPLIFLLGELSAQLLVLVFINMSLPIFGVWYISVLSITTNGMSLYRINKLEWPEITEAKLTKFLGLPHVRIKRKKGMPWSIPLYYRDPTSVIQKLTENIPPDNPLYKAVNKAHNN